MANGFCDVHEPLHMAILYANIEKSVDWMPFYWADQALTISKRSDFQIVRIWAAAQKNPCAEKIVLICSRKVH